MKLTFKDYGMFSKFFSRVFSRKPKDLDPNKIPRHIAIIMDGNGRWATKRGIPRVAGHRAGAEALKRIVRACGDIGVKHLTVYAFSTENWERPKNEVDSLMSLFSEVIDRELKELRERKIRIRFLGRLQYFPEELRLKMHSAMKETEANSEFNLNIMLNYGGRTEIVDAFVKILDQVKSGKLNVGGINEETIAQNLYTAGIPDPDMLIRTAYERRISNFLLWQIAYAELYFTKTLWPDFDKKKLTAAIIDYQERVRRFGRI